MTMPALVESVHVTIHWTKDSLPGASWRCEVHQGTSLWSLVSPPAERIGLSRGSPRDCCTGSGRSEMGPVWIL